MKETIVEKAAEMFLTLGFKSVTMDDIATELGISKKTIYKYFCNKNSLVKATVDDLFKKVSTGIDEIRGLDKNSIEEIFMIRGFMMQQLHNESTSPLYQLQKFFPKVFTCLRNNQFEKVSTSMVENLKKGIKSGIYRENINIDFISRMYFTGLTGIKDNSVFPTDTFTVASLTKQFLEYHLRAISTPRGVEILETILESENVKLT